MSDLAAERTSDDQTPQGDTSRIALLKHKAEALGNTDAIELIQMSDPNIYSGDLIEKDAVGGRIADVDQGEGIVASAKDIDWITTFGANPCFVIAVHYPEHKTGALAHVDPLTNVHRTLEEIQFRSRVLNYGRFGFGNPKFRAVISGGSLDSAREMIRAYREIDGWVDWYNAQNKELVVGEVFPEASESLALNLETGELRHFIPDPSNVRYDRVVGRVDIIGKSLGRPGSVKFIDPTSSAR
jgi:hypothetical protein